MGDGGRDRSINWGPLFRKIILPILLGLAIVAGIVVLFIKVPQVGGFFASVWGSVYSFFVSVWQDVCGWFAADSAAKNRSFFANIADFWENMNKAQKIFFCGFSAFGLFGLICVLFVKWRRLEGLFMLVAAVIYGSIFYVTLGGTVFIYSPWMYVLAPLCVIMIMLTGVLFGGGSISDSIANLVLQLFISVPAWFIFQWLHNISKEGKEVVPWLSVLQFLVFAISFVFQMIAFYNSGFGSSKDPSGYGIEDMTGEEDCMDVSDH